MPGNMRQPRRAYSASNSGTRRRSTRGASARNSREVFGAKRRGGADDVFAEAARRRLLGREQMRAHHVLDVDAPGEKLVGLDVGIRIGRADVRIVVLLGKEARGAQHHAREPVVAVEQLAEVLGRRLGRRRRCSSGPASTSSVIQAAGAPAGGISASPNTLVVLVKTKALHARRHRLLEQFSVPVMLTSTNSCRPWVATCGLCKVAACNTVCTPAMWRRTNARSTIEPTCVVNGEARTSMPIAARRVGGERAHQRLAEMPRAAGHQDRHGVRPCGSPPLRARRCGSRRR